MIQRVQTIFLFLAGLFFAGQFILPMANSVSTQTGYLADGQYDITDNTALMVITIVGIIMALAAILLFRNRKLQKSVSTLIVILSLVLLGAAYFFLNQASINPSTLSVNGGAFLPLGSIISALVANKFITKDDALVRSMDRLR